MTTPTQTSAPATSTAQRTTIAKALNAGMRAAMERDPEVAGRPDVVLHHATHCFRATAGG